MSKAPERGAAAVEFAMLLPVLLLLLLGIMEFGLAFNAQITLSQAAREGARVMAITGDPAAARLSARTAADALDSALNDGQIKISSSPIANPSGSASKIEDACVPGNQVEVSIIYDLHPVSGFAGPVSLIGKGAMRCEG